MSNRRQVLIGQVQGELSAPKANMFGFVSPVAGQVVRVAVQVDNAPIGGDATFTFKKAGTGFSTVTVVASATLGENISDVDLSGGTGLATVAAGDELTVDLATTPSSLGGRMFVFVELAEDLGFLTDTELGYTACRAQNAVLTKTVGIPSPNVTLGVYGATGTASPGTIIGSFGPIIWLDVLLSSVSAETITVEVILNFGAVPGFSAGGPGSIVKTKTSSGFVGFALSDIGNALANFPQVISSIDVHMKSSKNSSTATGSMFVSAYGTAF